MTPNYCHPGRHANVVTPCCLPPVSMRPIKNSCERVNLFSRSCFWSVSRIPPKPTLHWTGLPDRNTDKMTGRPGHWSEPGEYNILFLGSILVISSQVSSALGYREFTQDGAMTISPFAAREGTSAPQWPNVKKMLSSPRSIQ